MANSDRLAEVVALLAERDEEFRPFDEAQISRGESGEPLWSVKAIEELLGYAHPETLEKAVNRAKIAASKAEISIKDNFIPGDAFGRPEETYVTKYAALLIIMNADVRKERVALAQNYFALQVDRQLFEDEKRLRTRLDVATENHKLSGVAKKVGVQDFKKFNGVGVSALYGNLTVAQIRRRKGLKKNHNHLDYAGSEELAANLFRITQTAAALRRQLEPSEHKACETHRAVGEGVRKVIIQAGNKPPEQLPAARTQIDTLATKVKKRLT